MEYDNMHNIVSKEEFRQKSLEPSGGIFTDILLTPYNLVYSFDVNNKPHGPKTIIDKSNASSTGKDIKTKTNGYNTNGNLTVFAQKTGETLVDEHLNSHNSPFKFNAKEFDAETGNYYYGARYYDPKGSVWLSVDPLADHPKQVGISPYAFVNNNPIRYVDPTGMIWEKPKQAEKLNKSVNNRIEKINNNTAKLQNEIETGKSKFLFFSFDLNDKQMAKRKNKISENIQKVELLEQTLDDIEAIWNDPETFILTRPSASDGTHRVVKGADGIIKIEGSNTGLHIHEIRHVGQSLEEGGLKFNHDGQLLNPATTLEGARNNEVNAYQTQYSYDSSFPAGASSLKDINPTTLMNIKFPDGKPVYENLND